MSKILSTPELLQTIRIGEKAECVYYPNDVCTGWIVRRTELGLIGDSNGFRPVVLNHGVLKAKWKILPSFVSFEDALAAYKQGKTITCHFGLSKNGGSFVEHFSKKNIGKPLDFDMIIEGKWSIEDDKQ